MVLDSSPEEYLGSVAYESLHARPQEVHGDTARHEPDAEPGPAGHPGINFVGAESKTRPTMPTGPPTLSTMGRIASAAAAAPRIWPSFIGGSSPVDCPGIEADETEHEQPEPNPAERAGLLLGRSPVSPNPGLAAAAAHAGVETDTPPTEQQASAFRWVGLGLLVLGLVGLYTQGNPRRGFFR